MRGSQQLSAFLFEQLGQGRNSSLFRLRRSRVVAFMTSFAQAQVPSWRRSPGPARPPTDAIHLLIDILQLQFNQFTPNNPVFGGSSVTGVVNAIALGLKFLQTGHRIRQAFSAGIRP